MYHISHSRGIQNPSRTICGVDVAFIHERDGLALSHTVLDETELASPKANAIRQSRANREVGCGAEDHHDVVPAVEILS
jgi:hypothetical protein